MATSNTIENQKIEKLMKVATTETRLAVAEDTTYLYDTLAPTISVTELSGTAWAFEADSSLNKVNDIITPKSAPNEIGGSYRAVEYSTRNYAIRMMVTDADKKLYGNETVLMQQAIRNVTSALRGNMELRFYETFLKKDAGWKVTVTGQGTAGNIKDGQTQQWNDTASSPIKAIEDMKEINGTYAGNTKLNRVLMAKDVWVALKNHPEIQPILQGDSSSVKPDRALLNEFATLIEVERVDVIDQWQYVRTDKIRNITDDLPLANQIESATYIRPLTGIFMLYRYEPAVTLANKAAFNIIDATKNMVGFNRGIPTIEMYRHPDPGIKATYVDARISGGMHLSNPAGAVFCENMVATQP